MSKVIEKAEMPKMIKEKVTLYLEPWQKRMLKDYIRGIITVKVITKVVIDFTKPVHLNTYRLPFTDPREGIEFYFTDQQKDYLEELTQLKNVDSMRIEKAMFEAGTIEIR
jgi:hypothetical protein